MNVAVAVAVQVAVAVAIYWSGFGCTELSLSAIGTTLCALSFGHGPRGQGFEGFSKTLDFHDFFWGWQMQKKKHENTG